MRRIPERKFPGFGRGEERFAGRQILLAPFRSGSMEDVLDARKRNIEHMARINFKSLVIRRSRTRVCDCKPPRRNFRQNIIQQMHGVGAGKAPDFQFFRNFSHKTSER